jgi:hypothetical protein
MKMQSESINEIAAAVNKMQSDLKGASKDSSNPFYKSKYASLESCWEAVREPLTKNGLSIVQSPVYREKFFLRTLLCHTSGQWISSLYPIISKDETPQSVGSAVTYARRYSLCAMTGLYQEDDDAEAAQPRKPEQKPVAQAARPFPQNYSPYKTK